MAIQEVLQGCGAWSLSFTKPLPVSLQNDIWDGASLVVFESRPATDPVRNFITNVPELDALLSTALFMGPMTQISTTGCSGWEMSWWWQQPSGIGPPSVFGVGDTDYNDYFHGVLSGINDIVVDRTGSFNSNFITISGPAAGPGFVAPEPLTARSRADALVAAVTDYRRRFGLGEQFAWKMYPGGGPNEISGNVMTCRTDDITDLFDNDRVLISDVDSQAVLSDGLINVPAKLTVTRNIENVVSDVLAYGERNDTTGVTPVETVAQTPDIFAPGGSVYEARRLIDSGGNQSTLEEIAIGAGRRGLDPVVSVQAELLHDPWTKEVGPGERVAVWSRDERYLNNAEGPFQYTRTPDGDYADPLPMYVMSVTRNIGPGKSVWLRSLEDTGFDPMVHWVEITDYVELSDEPARVVLSSEYDPAYLAQGVVDAYRSAGMSQSSTAARRFDDELTVAKRLRRADN